MLKQIVVLVVACAVSSPAIATAERARVELGKVDLPNGNMELERFRCFQGDGATCLSYSREVFMHPKGPSFPSYRRGLDHGCYEKNVEECCRKIQKDRKGGDKIKEDCHAGDAESCLIYGDALIFIFDQRPEGLKYYQKSCGMKNPKACLVLDYFGIPHKQLEDSQMRPHRK